MTDRRIGTEQEPLGLFEYGLLLLALFIFAAGAIVGVVLREVWG